MTLNQPLRGFWNYHQSESEAGILPLSQNSPQKCPKDLFAEQISGTSFLTPRAQNLRSWLYREHPSVGHATFTLWKKHPVMTVENTAINPTQLRWDPLNIPSQKTTFLNGLHLWIQNGSVSAQQGMSAYLYAMNASMENEVFCNSDGDMLFIPESGEIELCTEFGTMKVGPTEIAVIPRGIKFLVNCQGPSRGYVGENFGLPLRLPDLGPIGANGLANPRHFIAPHAETCSQNGPIELIQKFGNHFWVTSLSHHPLNVRAWHGNYYPYQYDLKLFNTIGTVSFDHPDPSIFTVLTSPSSDPGMSNLDFVIFPPRWMVAEHTFRPPYFHRNIMSEYMGLIQGTYDAKPSGGFAPGGSSLHNSMSAHGPEKDAYEQAISRNLKPEYYGNTLAFMFESRYPMAPSKTALNHESLQNNYLDCWKGL